MSSTAPKLSINFPGKDVADAANGFYQGRAFRVDFDFLSEPSDLGVDRPVEGLPRATAGQIHQRLATEDPARMFNQGG